MKIIADCLRIDPHLPIVGALAWVCEGNPLFINLWCSKFLSEGLLKDGKSAEVENVNMPHAIRHYFVTLHDMFGPTKQGILRLLSLADKDLTPSDICKCLNEDNRRNPQIYQNHCESLVRVKVLTRFQKLTKVRRTPKHQRSISKTCSILSAAATAKRRIYHQSIAVHGLNIITGVTDNYTYQLNSENFRRVIRDMMLDSQVEHLKETLGKIGGIKGTRVFSNENFTSKLDGQAGDFKPEGKTRGPVREVMTHRRSVSEALPERRKK